MSYLDTKLLGVLDAGIEVRVIKQHNRQHNGFYAIFQVSLKQDSPNGGPPYTGQAQHEVLSTALKNAYNQLRTDKYGDAGENE